MVRDSGIFTHNRCTADTVYWLYWYPVFSRPPQKKKKVHKTCTAAVPQNQNTQVLCVWITLYLWWPFMASKCNKIAAVETVRDETQHKGWAHTYTLIEYIQKREKKKPGKNTLHILLLLTVWYWVCLFFLKLQGALLFHRSDAERFKHTHTQTAE